DRGVAAGAAQGQGQRFARLAGAQDDRVKTLRCHENAPTTKKSGSAATLSASGNLVAFYEVIAADEKRWQTAAERRLQEGISQNGWPPGSPPCSCRLRSPRPNGAIQPGQPAEDRHTAFSGSSTASVA